MHQVPSFRHRGCCNPSAAPPLWALSTAISVQDGPFADTKEQLAGTFVLDLADLDAALEWARQAPSIEWGAVEIRPGATYTVDGEWTANA